MGCDWWISIYVLFFFQGPFVVIIVMIDSSENAIIVSWVLNFRVRALLKSAVNLSHISHHAKANLAANNLFNQFFQTVILAQSVHLDFITLYIKEH